MHALLTSCPVALYTCAIGRSKVQTNASEGLVQTVFLGVALSRTYYDSLRAVTRAVFVHLNYALSDTH